MLYLLHITTISIVMKKLKLYLDNCCFNRPFDDQSQLKIYLETQAKLAIQEKILSGEYSLVWSYILDYENVQNPHDTIKREINKWQTLSEWSIAESTVVLEKARLLRQSNIEVKDALHVACAISAGVDYFITTDRKLLNQLLGHTEIRAVNPITFIEETD